MPAYVYRCTAGHEREVTHGMLDAPLVLCPECDQPMHKVPRVVAVTWGGLPPSREPERAKEVQNIIDPEQIAKRRDEYERMHNG